MAIHGKYLSTISVKGIYSNRDLDLSVYGAFNTQKVHWDYYVISHYKSGNIQYITDDICGCSYAQEATLDHVRKYGKSVNSVAEGEKYCQDFKIKWDTGSNNTTAEMRDKKLDEILNISK